MLAASAGASANLITNGDFSQGASGWTEVANGNLTTIDRGYWTVSGTSDSYLFQDFATTIGLTYEITFETNADFGRLWLIAGGSQLASVTGYDLLTVSFVATDTLSTIMFGANNRGRLTILDNVRVVAVPAEVPADVPEPASMALFGLGMAGIAALRRKRPA